MSGPVPRVFKFRNPGSYESGKGVEFYQIGENYFFFNDAVFSRCCNVYMDIFVIIIIVLEMYHLHLAAKDMEIYEKDNYNVEKFSSFWFPRPKLPCKYTWGQ